MGVIICLCQGGLRSQRASSGICRRLNVLQTSLVSNYLHIRKLYSIHYSDTGYILTTFQGADTKVKATNFCAVMVSLVDQNVISLASMNKAPFIPVNKVHLRFVTRPNRFPPS